VSAHRFGPGLIAMAAALATVLASTGCDDPLVPPEEIVDLRVLAARAETAGDPERASPRPGEEVTVRVLAAGPTGPTDVTWGMLACDAEETTTGLPRCRTEIARSQDFTASSAAPSLTFRVPADVGRLALVGVVCDGGTPRLSADADELDCTDARRSAPFVFSVTPSSAEDDDNQNPALAADALRLNDSPWTADVDDPCAEPGATAPTVAARSESTIALDLAGAAEPVAGEGSETLEVAHYVTAGDLERHFTVIEPGATPRAEITWKAPAAADTAMHLYAVARDGRGGVTWARRSLCVVSR
jgi:hypothetical protein